MHTHRRFRAAFTLVELLTVIAIIGILVAVLIPAVNAARESARRVECDSRIKQIGVALLNYEGNHRVFPPGYVAEVDEDGTEHGPGWGWAAHILREMEQAPLADQVNFKTSVDADECAELRTSMIKSFLCPSDGVAAVWTTAKYDKLGKRIGDLCQIAPANYIGVFGITEPGVEGEGVFFRNSHVRTKDIVDGASHTFVVGERSHRWCQATWVGVVRGASLYPPENSPAVPFVQNASGMVLGHTFEGLPNGENIECNNFCSEHPNGANFVYGDGHVQFITTLTDYQVYLAMSTRAGGESLEGDTE